MAEGNPNKAQDPEEMEKPAEFDFHQERFARKDARRNPLTKLIEGPGPHDFPAAAYAEAQRDNEDFDKRQHPEFKESYEALQIVVENIKEKRDHPENKNIRAILFGMGAGMRIPYGIGQVLGLEEAGIEADTFDALYGTSASSALMLYYAAGREAMLKGASMVTEDLASPRFINKMKVREGEIVNLREFKRQMEEGPKRLTDQDIQAIREAAPDINIVVTRPVGHDETAEAEFLDAKKLPNMVDGVRASMSIDSITGEIPEIEGVSYRDGSFDPMPIDKIIDDYASKHGGVLPTDILVCVNTPFETIAEFRLSRSEEIGVAIAKRFASLTPVEKVLMIREQLRQSFEITKDIKARRGVNIGFIWPPNMGLGTLTIDPDDMKAATLESARNTVDVFGEQQPHEIAWYKPEEDPLSQQAA